MSAGTNRAARRGVRLSAARVTSVIAAVLTTVLGLLAVATSAMALSTLEVVRQRGNLVCGVGEGVVGFSELGPANRWQGLDADYCRAVAAAVLGDKERVVFRVVATADRFTALRAGEIDILARGAVWALSRDAGEGVSFVAALFHDAAKLMVRRADGLTSALELSGASICVLEGSDTESALAAFFASRGMRYQALTSATWAELVMAYRDRRCLAFAGDTTVLANERARLGGDGAHVLLPERLSHAPLGPVVRDGNEQWFDITRWVLFALIGAEEYGVTSANAATMADGQSNVVRQMLGSDGDLGARLGLSRGWMRDLIRQVGNYAEIYERSFGAGSPLKLPRGQNALARDGGLHWAPPFR